MRRTDSEVEEEALQILSDMEPLPDYDEPLEIKPLKKK